MKIALIGGGVMAEAIIGGTLRAALAQPSDITVGEPLKERRDALGQRYGITATPDNLKAIEGADVLLLSVKPQQLPEVLKGLGGKVQKGQVVLSIVAGARLSTLTRGMGHDAVVRAMPNTPAQVGQGTSVWTATQAVEAAQREAARSILRTLGDEVYVRDEKYLDMATALSGSGPAYVFLFLEALEDAGVYLGMSRDMARGLAVQTVLGSAALAKETGKHPAELRNMVTSPGGTTAEALLELESGGFPAAVMQAVVAAYEKAQSMGEDS